jgi:hypothetical protein
MKNGNFLLMMLGVFLLMLWYLTSCGVTYREEGTSRKEYIVQITYPLCDRPDWSYEQVMGCIEKCTTIVIDGKIYDVKSLIEGQKLN